MEIIGMTILGIVIGISVLYLILRPKLRHIEQLNSQIIQQNEQLKQDKSSLQEQIAILETKREQVVESISLLESQAKQAADTFYKQSMELVENNFDAETTRMSKEIQEWKIEAEEEYLSTLKDSVEQFNEQLFSKKEELSKLDTLLKNLRDTVSAAVEADKRAIEMEQKTDFYRLVISDDDKREIVKLREVEQYLRDVEPLNKVIWKMYYEKPTTAMIGRVLGNIVHTGIYKITNIDNGMCYVGQAVNIADRWKQHIKRGLGAEAATRNKLYPAMYSIGVENFTFEVVEECDRASLDAREDYWQDYFHAKDFGYSIK